MQPIELNHHRPPRRQLQDRPGGGLGPGQGAGHGLGEQGPGGVVRQGPHLDRADQRPPALGLLARRIPESTIRGMVTGGLIGEEQVRAGRGWRWIQPAGGVRSRPLWARASRLGGRHAQRRRGAPWRSGFGLPLCGRASRLVGRHAQPECEAPWRSGFGLSPWRASRLVRGLWSIHTPPHESVAAPTQHRSFGCPSPSDRSDSYNLRMPFPL